MQSRQSHTRGAFETADPIEQDRARLEPRRNSARSLLLLAALVLLGIAVLVVLI